MSILTFTALLLGAGALYVVIDRLLLRPRDKLQLLRRQVVNGNHAWWLTTVLYTGFCFLVFFMLSTAFAVEAHLNNTGTMLYYMTVIFPAAVTIAPLFYFACRWGFERFLV